MCQTHARCATQTTYEKQPAEQALSSREFTDRKKKRSSSDLNYVRFLPTSTHALLSLAGLPKLSALNQPTDHRSCLFPKERKLTPHQKIMSIKCLLAIKKHN